MNNLVSIIIPVFNTAQFLNKCLNSVTNQSYRNLEIIVVNDGSFDTSEIVCKEFESKDSRITYIYKENGGLSSARNVGLELANGEYISFIDSDDFIDKDFIKILLAASLKHKSSIAVCGRKIVSERSEKEMFVFNRQKMWSSQEAVERMLTWNGIDGSVCDKLFHKSHFLTTRFSEGRISEDLPIVANALIDAKNIVHVGSALYNYLQRSGSITSSSFSKNKMSILISSSEVRSNVLVKYPNLNKEADFYHFHHVYHLRKLLIGIEKQYPEELQMINKEFSENLKRITFNPYFPLKKKIVFYLLVLGFGQFLRRKAFIYR